MPLPVQALTHIFLPSPGGFIPTPLYLTSGAEFSSAAIVQASLSGRGKETSKTLSSL